MPARSFEEILADLLSLKEELLRLHYAYSPVNAVLLTRPQWTSIK